MTDTVCFPGFQAHFVNQFSVTPGPFSDSGDSGSLIVAQGSNQPVGLLFAGGDGLTIANPIDAVLQRFNVTIDGAPSGPGPPGAPTALNAIAGDGQVALSWTAPSFDGGSSISSYVVYRGTSSEPGGRPDDDPGGDELYGHERRERHDLLLQGVRGQQRQRRGREVERGERDPDRGGRADCAVRTARRLQSAGRDPLRRRPLDERDHRRRDRLRSQLEPARVLGRDDVHRLAQ